MNIITSASVKDICERIFALEAEHGLLDLQVDGVKVWQFRRMHIYYRIAQACGVLDDPQPIQHDFVSVLKRRYHNVSSILLHSPFNCSEQVDILIFDHARSKLIDGVPVDIYTHFLLHRLREEGQRVLVVEGSWQGRHVRPLSPERRHMEAINFRYFLDLVAGRHRCSAEGMRQIEVVHRLVQDTFGIAVDLRKLLRESVQRFKSNARSYEVLLNRVRPKCVYFVVGYSHFAPLVHVARAMGIRTVELQHGVISRYHLGYSFPGKPVLEYFADSLESWGAYWGDLPELPLPRKQVVDSGFPYFHYMSKMHSGIKRQSGQLLVLSQTAIGQDLAQKVLQAVESSRVAIRIMYKLHPGEFLSWRKNQALVRLSALPNVEIIDRDCDLYRLLAESEYQTGVFSTAIFEGIQMGCKTILFNLPGIEYMDNLLEKGMVVCYDETCTLEENLRGADAVVSTIGNGELFGPAVEF